ncbi:MAG: CBS domain-containing protein [Polyangiales bacterium]
MRITDLMSRDVKPCYARDSLATGARRLQQNDGRCAPVVDHRGRVVGLLTDKEVARAAATVPSPASETPVAVVMRRSPVTAHAHEPVEDAHERMRETGARCLVVTDEDGVLAGLLSLDDLAGQAMRELRLDGREFWAKQVARTLACCGEDREGPAAA